MRILQVLAGAAEGGAETFFESLVGALARAGLDQHAVIRSNPRRADVMRAAGLTPVEVPFHRYLDFRTGRALRQEISRYRPDIVMTWMSRASLMVPPHDALQVARLGGYYDMKYYRRCDHLFCITKRIGRHCVERGRDPAGVHYMPNFALIEQDAPVSRRDFDTPEDATVLLALSRLHVNKALDVLLQALVREPRAYAWLAGEGPLRSELEALAAQLGVAERVRFLGWRSDRAALMAAADICVFPSRHEPFGTVSLEAWGYERPLVVAASDGPADLVVDGEDALLVPINDAEALATAITRVIDEPGLSERLVAVGKHRYETEFTEAACVARYQAKFDALLGAPRNTTQAAAG